MAFTDQAALAEDSTFRTRVRVALMTAAKDVMGEEQTYSDAQYGLRQALADEVIAAAGGGAVLERFVWLVITNPAITGESSDNDIQFTVNSLWDDAAGVRVTD